MSKKITYNIQKEKTSIVQKKTNLSIDKEKTSTFLRIPYKCLSIKQREHFIKYNINKNFIKF